MEQRARLRGEDLHRAIIERRKSGKTYGEIVEELGCSYGTVSTTLRGAGLTNGSRPAEQRPISVQEEAQHAPVVPEAAAPELEREVVESGRWPRKVVLPDGVTVMAGAEGVALVMDSPKAMTELLEVLGVRVEEIRAAIVALQSFVTSI